MGKPKAPEPPDPKETSAASTGTSVSTAIANTMLGNVNQVGPTGSLSYDRTGSYDFTDPYTGHTYNLPTFTATTSLSPEQQQIFDQSQSAQLGLAQVANQQTGRLRDLLSRDFTPEGLPDRGTVPVADQATRQRIEQALMDRLNPQIDRDRQAMETRLANQGLTAGSRAYGASQDDFSRGVNDARLGAILAGGDEMARQYGLEMGAFNAQNDLRAQALQEQMAMRNQPINEITALLSGSQVSMPNFRQNQPSAIPTTDNAGLINQNYQQRYGNYQQQLGNWNSGLGGLFGLGAAAITASDRRLKRDIRAVGNRGPLTLYEYRYLWDEPCTVRRGYMAQEVARVVPQAVVRLGRWLGLDYNLLPEVA